VSGHSKWSTIKHKKGAADAKRGKLFTKLSRSILVAAKEGGPDPATNMALANAIEKARSYSMPKDNIDRAIAKGSGEGTDGAMFETVVYEGYGPEGRCRARRGADRQPQPHRRRRSSPLLKHGGNLGATGAVAWQFERRGIVLVQAAGVDEDELFLAVADAGADDVEQDGSVFQIASTPEQLQAVRQAVEGAGFTVESAELSMVPKVTVRDRGRADREEGGATRRGARGQRRRPGRLRQLRHPRGRTGGSGLVSSGEG
jgi:YebC/PmpR family DNA-binding regulatory protein